MACCASPHGRSAVSSSLTGCRQTPWSSAAFPALAAGRTGNLQGAGRRVGGVRGRASVAAHGLSRRGRHPVPSGDSCWRLGVALLGSVTMSLLDTLGVAALVPLVQLATSDSRDTGAIGYLSRAMGGNPSDAQLAVVIAVFMVTAFVLKGILGITLRRWQARLRRPTGARDRRAAAAWLPHRAVRRLHRPRDVDAGLPRR